ncbi:MAG: hypothetical protein R6W86_16575 [Marinobacter sp.]|uniref:hypothetical protein n=1 Tax=Marinobacter sp. TaxID=50741 RepID=UPI00396EC1FD
MALRGAQQVINGAGVAFLVQGDLGEDLGLLPPGLVQGQLNIPGQFFFFANVFEIIGFDLGQTVLINDNGLDLSCF